MRESRHKQSTGGQYIACTRASPILASLPLTLDAPRQCRLRNTAIRILLYVIRRVRARAPATLHGRCTAGPAITTVRLRRAGRWPTLRHRTTIRHGWARRLSPCHTRRCGRRAPCVVPAVVAHLRARAMASGCARRIGAHRDRFRASLHPPSLTGAARRLERLRHRALVRIIVPRAIQRGVIVVWLVGVLMWQRRDGVRVHGRRVHVRVRHGGRVRV